MPQSATSGVVLTAFQLFVLPMFRGRPVLACDGTDLTLRIWNRSYECITIHPPMKQSIRCVVASPQGGVIAIGSYDGRVNSIPAGAS